MQESVKPKLGFGILIEFKNIQMKIFTEEEMRYAAGHPDATPKAFIDAFVRGAEWMQRQLLQSKEETAKDLPVCDCSESFRAAHGKCYKCPES